MKNLLLTFGLLFVLNAQADIEHSANEEGKATPEEIGQSRSCFLELEVQGCGDPGDDQQQFRSCLKNVHSSLSENCKKMMKELYGT